MMNKTILLPQSIQQEEQQKEARTAYATLR